MSETMVTTNPVGRRHWVELVEVDNENDIVHIITVYRKCRTKEAADRLAQRLCKKFAYGLYKFPEKA